ncbi:MAG TPA: 50S ribosomal protein L17 [Candidatus Paceibacterota bacterium]|nr:50S ribosomal protein L17 [Candidatus Paceibacterota bacterium]
MRHHVKGRNLGRPKNQRVALKKSLMRSLIIHERIATTEAKAKEIRPLIEKMVTRARTDSVANRRLTMARIGDADAVKKLFTTIAPRFKGQEGGYVRIVKRAVKADGRKNAYIAFTK